MQPVARGSQRRSSKKSALVGLLLAAVLVALMPPLTSRAEPVVPFAPRFSADDNGTVAVFGNNLLSCPATDTRCAAARAGTAAVNNNSFAMQNLDADDVAGTFNSSSSEVTAPPNAEVLWAGLYWGARLSRANGGVAGVGDRKVIQLRAPGGAYLPITSQAGFGPTAGDQAYQEFADVTSTVRAAGPGTYWGANVVAGTGEDRYAGWSLAVVYRAPGLPLRNLTVFDGFADVGRDEPETISLSGFRTPVTGPVETQLGMVAYEGDFSTSGDNARLNGTLLSTTPLSRGSNFFNGTNDDNGASVQARNPAHLNMLGFDIKNLAATGIPNGATGATISLESTGDRYFPGVVTTAIRLFAPDFTTSAKTVANLAGRTPALPGDELEYTLTYPNTGQDPATNAVLTDTLPPGTTFVSATPSAGSCTGSGRDVGCTIGTIGVGATWEARVRATVDADAGGTTLTNAAVLDYRAATLGRDLSYVVAPAVIDVDAIADLSLAKTMSPDPGTAGGQVTSLLSVANDGPNAAIGVVLTDELPAGTTFVSSTTSQGSCSEAAGTVTCELGTIPDGATVEVGIALALPAGSTATSIVNVASVASQTADLDPTDNSAGNSVAVVRAADLSVAKTASEATVTPGGTSTFTVTITNTGPSDAVDVVVSDTVQDAALVLTAASAPGAACTAGGEAARCAIDVLAAGASLVMTVEARVSPDAPEGLSLANTATATSSTPDPEAGNNSDSATVTTTPPQADIVTAKTSSDATSGGQVSYAIVVTNNGPSTADSVIVSDALPPGLSISSAVSSRGTCTPVATVTCELGPLPGPDASGQPSSATITVVADIAADVPPGGIANTASAVSPTADPAPGNNDSTATTAVSALADVSITKTATPVQPAAGEDVTYALTIANSGPSAAAGVVVTDVLPPGLTLLGVDPGTGVDCDVAATVTCTVGTLAPGQSATVDIRMNVPADFNLDTGAANTATVESATPDPTAGNNTATATITARAISDLSVIKWDTTPAPPDAATSPRSFAAGELVTYYVAAINSGPSAAATARVTDTLPPGVSFVSADAPCVFAPPNQVVCDLPTVPVNVGVSAAITVRIAADLADGTSLTNTAAVELTDPARVDPSTSNNFASLTNPVTTLADLDVVKQTYSLDLPDFGFVTPSSAPAGTPTGYFIDVRNDGPSVARDVVVVDSSTMTEFFVNQVRVIRPGLDPETIDITAECSWTGGDLQCPLGDLPVFETGDAAWRIQVDGITPSSATAGDYLNTATLTSPTPDADATDNTSQAPITVTAPAATLTMDKTVLGGTDIDGDGDSDIVPGTTFGYQLSVANVLDLQREGAADAPNVLVTDTLPAGLVPTSVTATQGSCEITLPSSVTCDLGTVLGPGRVPEPPPVLITISGTVQPGIAGQPSVTNTATVTSPISAEASDVVSQDVVAVADLALTKIPDAAEFAAGSVAGFSLVATNAGPSDAVLTEVGDLFPPELVFDPASSDPACTVVTQPEGSFVSCAIGTLVAGESRTVRVGARIAPDQAPTSVVNTAAVASPVTGEYEFENNLSQVPVTIVRSADLVVGKIADAASHPVGGQVTYTATVTNAGPSDAESVVLVDVVPAGLSFVEAVGADGLSCAFADGVVTCTAPTLAAGATASATIVLALPPGLEPGPVLNTVTASSATPDPDEANDSASVSVDAYILADMSIRKSVVTSQPTAGRPVVFALDVLNKGPQTSPRIVVSDSLPAGVTFVSAEVPGGGSCQVNAPEGIDIVTCEVGSLEVGAEARLLVTVLPAGDLASIRNGALVGSSAQDLFSLDNYDEVEVELAEPPTDPAPTEPPPASGGGAPPAGAPGTAALPATGGGVPWIIPAIGASALLLGGALLLLRRRRAA